MANLSGIMALSPGGIGPEIALPLVKSKEIINLVTMLLNLFIRKI